MSTKESDLVTAAFIYVSRAIAEGDIDAMRRMRLGYDDIQLFTDLRLGDMQRMAMSRPHSHFLEIAWKLCDLRTAVQRVQNLRDDAETKLALIKSDACREMMAHLYGVTNNEYSGYLAMLGVVYAGGRPPKLSDQDSTRLWDAWQQIAINRTYEEISAVEYLELHVTTGISLRAVWQQAKQWANLGGPQPGLTKSRRPNIDTAAVQPSADSART